MNPIHRLLIAALSITRVASNTWGISKPIYKSVATSSIISTPESVDKMINHLPPDTTASSLKKELNNSPLSLLVTIASFNPACRPLLAQLADLEKDYMFGGSLHSCTGPSSQEKPKVWILKTDDSEELEELAVELGMDVPSYRIYKNGVQIGENKGRVVTVEEIREGLRQAAAQCCPSDNTRSSASCCPPSSGTANAAVCCPDGSKDAPSDPSAILRLVQQSYANTVNKSPGGCCVSVSPELLGYTPEQIAAASDSNLGLGCGNPLSFADVKQGETVVDLGSGAGVDCFLASEQVGREGQVIGVDMTSDMVFTARGHAADRKCTNVSFRLGEIEHLPIADGTADVVISNCVINLSPVSRGLLRSFINQYTSCLLTYYILLSTHFHLMQQNQRTKVKYLRRSIVYLSLEVELQSVMWSFVLPKSYQIDSRRLRHSLAE